MIQFQVINSVEVAGDINNAICGHKLVDFMKKVPQFFEKAKLISPPPDQLPTNSLFQEAYCAVYPHLEIYLCCQMLCVKKENSLEMTGIYARLNGMGRSYAGEMKNIYFQEDSPEALLEFETTTGRTLTFFDYSFTANREIYVGKSNAVAVIFGIATNVELSDSSIVQNIEITNPMVAEVMGIKVGESINIDMGQSRTCLSRTDAKNDGYELYEFRGKIHSIREIELSLIEETGWVCSLDIFWNGENEQSTDEDLLEIYIPQHLWQEKSAPQVGDFLMGITTLCGFIAGVE